MKHSALYLMHDRSMENHSKFVYEGLLNRHSSPNIFITRFFPLHGVMVKRFTMNVITRKCYTKVDIHCDTTTLMNSHTHILCMLGEW